MIYWYSNLNQQPVTVDSFSYIVMQPARETMVVRKVGDTYHHRGRPLGKKYYVYQSSIGLHLERVGPDGVAWVARMSQSAAEAALATQEGLAFLVVDNYD
jgi:hypothetical protein